MSPMHDRYKKWVFIVGVNGFLLLLVFVLLEAGLRYFKIPYDVQWTPMENAVAQFDEELGWSYVPYISKTMRVGGVESIKVVNIDIDGNGIRVPFRGFRWDDQRPTVLFIGGSFTMGHGVSYEESFVGQFGSLIGTSHQAVNLGVQAYGSDQALLALKRHFHDFNTKLVIYTFIEDHIVRNGNHDRQLLIPDARFLGTKPRMDLDNDGKPFLADTPTLYSDHARSYVLDLVKISVGQRLGVFPSHPEQLTKAIVSEMNDYCRNNGADFAMLNWRWLESDYDGFDSLDVAVIDALENAPDEWAEMKIPDGHPDADASHRVARLVLDHARRNTELLPD